MGAFYTSDFWTIIIIGNWNLINFSVYDELAYSLQVWFCGKTFARSNSNLSTTIIACKTKVGALLVQCLFLTASSHFMISMKFWRSFTRTFLMLLQRTAPLFFYRLLFVVFLGTLFESCFASRFFPRALETRLFHIRIQSGGRLRAGWQKIMWLEHQRNIGLRACGQICIYAKFEGCISCAEFVCTLGLDYNCVASALCVTRASVYSAGSYAPATLIRSLSSSQALSVVANSNFNVNDTDAVSDQNIDIDINYLYI